MNGEQEWLEPDDSLGAEVSITPDHSIAPGESITPDRAMRLAVDEAFLAQGRTAPNPSVGCVIVSADGRFISKGRTAPMTTGAPGQPGPPHAEVLALESAGAAAAGSTLYVTLEPCCHWGRTPPCTDAIIRAGVKRVVAAVMDPDVRVSGQGMQKLIAAGITAVFQPIQAQGLNEGYFKFKRTGLPFVLLKMAMTLDGKIASASGDSKWITSAAARSHVQSLRDSMDAVMVGIGTILADNPRLTVRPDQLPSPLRREARNPVRVIMDSHARLPSAARVLHAPGRRIVLCAAVAPPADIDRLRQEGAEVIVLEEENRRPAFSTAMTALAETGIHSVLLEGGPALAASALHANAVDRALFFVAPKILGGQQAPGPVGGAGAGRMADALLTGPLRVRRFGPDIALEADIPGPDRGEPRPQ